MRLETVISRGVVLSRHVALPCILTAPSLGRVPLPPQEGEPIGREVGLAAHLKDGREYQIPVEALLEHGRRAFGAVWTPQEGGGRPLSKGTGAPLSDPSDPLVFPRAFNRVSAPDANSCAGCHHAPFGLPGGGGDIVANVFVLGQRFDALTFDPDDLLSTKGATDELGRFVRLPDVANSRNTLGMYGSGYIEMLARQITRELQEQRDLCPPGDQVRLRSKGIDFGTLSRDPNGRWDCARVAGLVAPSLASEGPAAPPSLILRPFHQSAGVVSLRQFTNNAMNHHHGMQSAERFGAGTDPDGDGFTDELTRADVTATTAFQATLPVPGRVIPRDADVERAVHLGEGLFVAIGCAECHVPRLPLDGDGWIFVEPNPFNPPGNLRPGDAPDLFVDLASDRLPQPRLKPVNGVVEVMAFTDLKVHDISSGPGDPNGEALDMNAPAGSTAFFAGNRRFLTRKLWGCANEPPYFHHGQFTTLRQAVLAHSGEALAARRAFEALADGERNAVIEMLKTLQVLPPGTRSLAVDERGRPRDWQPAF